MCAQRVQAESKSTKGRRGIATLVKLSDSNARIDFEKVEANKGYPEQAAVSYEIKASFGEDGTIPEYVPFKKMKPNQKISLSATMNEEGTKILYSQPASGYYEVKFKKFVTKNEGDSPTPETKTNRKDSSKTYRQFECLFEITGGQWNNLSIQDGVWKGANYWYRMYDNFAPGVDNTLAVKGSGDGSLALIDFLDAVVGGGEQLQFSENPLPAIQEEAYRLDTRFYINVAKGWVVSLVVPLPLDEEIGFLEQEEIPDALKEEGE